VLVTFRNGATAKTAQTHDWVLVRPGHQSQVVSLGVGAGVGSGDPDYEPSVLARTQLIPPGQSSSVLFEAPIRPGDYPYLSTAEGDWPSMQGILVVSAIR
jgi:azurin